VSSWKDSTTARTWSTDLYAWICTSYVGRQDQKRSGSQGRRRAAGKKKQRQPGKPRSVDDLPAPLNDDFSNGWDGLLQLEPGTGSHVERARWCTRTLPLMARPEIGLPRYLQEKLLQHQDLEVAWLAAQRERLITDAIVASDEERGRTTPDRESQEKARRLADVFEQRHKDVEKEASPWKTKVGGFESGRS
jgi:hypothetical protein